MITHISTNDLLMSRFYFPLLAWAFLSGYVPSAVAAPTNDERPLCVNSIAANIRPDCGPGNGRISVVHNGTAPFTYTWSHAATLNDSVASNLNGGVYTVTVSDGAGCSVSETFTVPVQPLIVAGNSFADTCGRGNGRAEVFIVTGTQPFQIQWDSLAGNQTTVSVSGLRAGPYRVTVRDAAGCVFEQNLVVAATTNNFGLNVAITPVSCLGRSDGQATAVVTGGTGAYNFAWRQQGNPLILQTTNPLSAVTAGFYELTVSDGPDGSCTITRAVTINAPDTIRPNVQVFPTTLCGQDNGRALATPTNGTAPFRFLWSNGDTANLAENLAPGGYFLDVTDANGCISPRAFIVITTGPGPDLTIDTLQADVCGLGQGIVRVRITGGQGPFRINWEASAPQPSDTAFAYNLRPQPLQRVFVRDANECFKVAYFDVPGNPPMEVTAVNTTENYCNLADGTATVEVRGGSAPYTYLWTTNPPQTGPTATEMPGGTFEIIVTDANLCQIRATATVENTPGFTLFTQSTNVTCYGKRDGTAEAINWGGVFPLNFAWSTTPPRGGARIENLGPGTYTVTATDQRGCSRSSFSIITQPDSLKAAFTTLPDTLGPLPVNLATLRFENQSIGATNFIWSFGTGDTSVLRSPTYLFPEPGLFTIKLLAYNNGFQCVDSAKYGPVAIVEDGKLFVPAAFSPNSDGYNDTYQIKGENIREVELRIFSRFGQEIYFSDSLDGEWDGNLPTGGSAPMGVYMYTLRVVFNDTQVKFQKGTITLIR